MGYRNVHLGNQFKLTPIVKGSVFTRIALVCLLLFTTLWLSTATAAHIHLHEHPLHCDSCLSSGSDAVTLETQLLTLNIEITTTERVVYNYVKPQLIPVTSRKSRAPPVSL